LAFCPQVYIVGHMPPGVDERHLGRQHNKLTFTEHNNQRYLEMVRRYAPVIQGQFFGHLHSDTFRLIYDAKGAFSMRLVLYFVISSLD